MIYNVSIDFHFVFYTPFSIGSEVRSEVRDRLQACRRGIATGRASRSRKKVNHRRDVDTCAHREYMYHDSRGYMTNVRSSVGRNFCVPPVWWMMRRRVLMCDDPQRAVGARQHYYLNYSSTTILLMLCCDPNQNSEPTSKYCIRLEHKCQQRLPGLKKKTLKQVCACTLFRYQVTPDVFKCGSDAREREQKQMEGLRIQAAAQSEQNPRPPPQPACNTFFLEGGGDIFCPVVRSMFKNTPPHTPRSRERKAQRGRRAAVPAEILKPGGDDAPERGSGMYMYVVPQTCQSVFSDLRLQNSFQIKNAGSVCFPVHVGGDAVGGYFPDEYRSFGFDSMPASLCCGSCRE